jgi:hypothetical protein
MLVAHLVSKFLVFYGTRRFITVEMTNFSDIIHRLSLIKTHTTFRRLESFRHKVKKDTYSVGPNG